jgi:ATP-dependent Clp protease adapter protein ClpS
MEAVEALDNADDDAWNFSLATLVGKAQNQEVVSHILQGVLNITRYQTQQTTMDTHSMTLPSGEILRKEIAATKRNKFRANNDDLAQSVTIT